MPDVHPNLASVAQHIAESKEAMSAALSGLSGEVTVAADAGETKMEELLEEIRTMNRILRRIARKLGDDADDE